MNAVRKEAEAEYQYDPDEQQLVRLQDPVPEPTENLPAPDALTPADRYLELFEEVQTTRIFADSKTFPDCSPKYDPLDVLTRYRQQKRAEDFDLARFVSDHFYLPTSHDSFYVSNPDKTLTEHIDALWPVLTKMPQQHMPHSSLLPLPKPYVVPGGRFGETYYWDSYFTMLGLAESGRDDLLRHMADNFAWLIDNYGHIPNGNRTYYLSRSQPPVFALMVELFEEDGVRGAKRYLDQLMKEYQFWMDGAEKLTPGQAYRHVVRMADGSLLNRYWDDRDTPRDESWLEDIETARHSGRPASEVYRDLRAGAASGWDYSSRWLRDPKRLASIRTTHFVPIDLNGFLYKLELMIATLSHAKGEEETALAWQKKAAKRKSTINRYLWDSTAGVYRDYDWRRQRFGAFTAAAVVPLFVGLATPWQAHLQAIALRQLLLSSGGLVTSMLESGEQWDKPNGWAPLQWMAVAGLSQYGEEALATEIAVNWLTTVNHFYQLHHKLVEKYDIGGDRARPGGGGEYPLQDGFGWTNGVTRRLLAQYGHLIAD